MIWMDENIDRIDTIGSLKYSKHVIDGHEIYYILFYSSRARYLK